MPQRCRATSAEARFIDLRENHNVDNKDALRKIAALKAIIQALMPGVYWDEDLEGSMDEFLERLADDEPVALAISNELSGGEIGDAFAWEKRSHKDIDEEMEGHPVTGHLSEAQAGRARVRIVAMDGAEAAVELATKEYEPADAKYPIRNEDRVEIGASVLVEWMMDDAAKRRGEAFTVKNERSIDASVNDLPEPWRTHARRRLEEVRRAIGEVLKDAEEY